MMVSQTISGLTVGSKIKAPMPFTGEAEIIGFRYYTNSRTGRTCVVADYLFTKPDGTVGQSFNAIDQILNAQAEAKP